MKYGILAAVVACLLASTAAAQVPDRIADRPISSGPPTTVKAGLYYIDISDIDGANEAFSATLYLLLEWNDPRLRFETKDPSKVKLYKPEDIWTPAVEVINAAKLEDQQTPMCQVISDGTVFFQRRVVASLNTPMDLHRFPFDRQQMSFIIESSRFGKEDLVFEPNPVQSGLGMDIVTREWRYDPLTWKVVAERFAKTDETYSRLIFTFQANRDPYYFIWKVIFPTAVFVLLSWSIFWMQVHDVQTTLAVSITILLTAVAFGNVADSMVPKLGYRTWMDQFQLGSFLFIVSTVIETIAVYLMNLRGETDRARKVRNLTRIAYPISYVVFCFILFAVALA